MSIMDTDDDTVLDVEEIEIDEDVNETEDGDQDVSKDDESLADDTILEDSQENDTDDEKPKKPSRAEKRIRGLISKTKQYEEDLKVASEYIKKITGELDEARNRNKTAETAYIEEADDRLAAQLSQARKDYLVAQQEGDDEAMLDANERLADVKVEQRNLTALKARMETAAEVPEEDESEAAPTRPQPKPDPRAMQWAKENQDWFIPVGGEQTPLNKRKSAMVQVIHSELLEEGFDPTDADDEYFGQEAYYEEIDKRMDSEFSAQVAVDEEEESPQTQPVVAGGAHTPSAVTTKGGKTKVKLTRSQIERARSMGVSVEDYAREVAKIAKREGR